jgi:hypothetical protein
MHLWTKAGLGTGAGLVVGVSGLDGSGKSTLLGRLTSCLHRAGASTPRAVHLLPSWIPMPHQVFRRKKTRLNYTRPYSEPAVLSALSAHVRLAYYLLAFLLARGYLSVLAIGDRLVVLDRNFIDFVSDLTRARIPARTLPVWMVRALAPRGLIFYLAADPEAVVKRKGELSLEKARMLDAQYRITARATRAAMLDGNADPDTVFRHLLEKISAEFMRRLGSRVGFQ